MAHALKKAECAREPNPAMLAVGAAGFLLEHVHLFSWRGEELRLSAGMADYYADFSRTSLAGRVGQAMALLFLEDRGYTYASRLSAEIKRQNGQNVAQSIVKAKAKRKAATPPRAPDFIVENGKGERALAEAKGAFVTPKETCDIKGSLKDALDQLDGWDQHLTPQPLKNFAIGTFLREADDFSDETSLLAFVDPEPGEPEHPIEIPPDAIRRANYASWLALMGFDDVAERLRSKDGRSRTRTVPVLKLGSHSYVVKVASIRPWFPQGGDPELWQYIDDWRHWFFDPSAGLSLEIVGLDLRAVRGFGPMLDQSAVGGVMSLEPNNRREIPREVDGGRFYGSVFSDGSLLGELRITRHHRQLFESTEVVL